MMRIIMILIFILFAAIFFQSVKWPAKKKKLWIGQVDVMVDTNRYNVVWVMEAETVEDAKAMFNMSLKMSMAVKYGTPIKQTYLVWEVKDDQIVKKFPNNEKIIDSSSIDGLFKMLRAN